MTVWTPISGYEGMYEVSNEGQVRSVERQDNLGRIVHKRILSPTNNGHGYLSVQLCDGETKVRHYVHRLVAEAFVPNPFNLMEINHIDECPDNNIADNLEWCTRKYNVNYRHHNEHLSLAKGSRFIVTDNHTGVSHEFHSMDLAAKELKVGWDKIKAGINAGRIVYHHGKLQRDLSFTRV
jgi:hypothetical protein